MNKKNSFIFCIFGIVSETIFILIEIYNWLSFCTTRSLNIFLSKENLATDYFFHLSISKEKENSFAHNIEKCFPLCVRGIYSLILYKNKI